MVISITIIESSFPERLIQQKAASRPHYEGRHAPVRSEPWASIHGSVDPRERIIKKTPDWYTILLGYTNVMYIDIVCTYNTTCRSITKVCIYIYILKLIIEISE